MNFKMRENGNILTKDSLWRGDRQESSPTRCGPIVSNAASGRWGKTDNIGWRVRGYFIWPSIDIHYDVNLTRVTDMTRKRAD